MLIFRVLVEFFTNEKSFKERLQLYFIKNQRSSKYLIVIFWQTLAKQSSVFNIYFCHGLVSYIGGVFLQFVCQCVYV